MYGGGGPEVLLHEPKSFWRRLIDQEVFLKIFDGPKNLVLCPLTKFESFDNSV